MPEDSVKRYILRETATAALINALFSLGFAWAFFRTIEFVSQQELILDALPQSFAVTLFGVLIPTLITRARIYSGKIEALPYRRSRLPRNPILRAVSMGILAAFGGALLHLLVLRGLRIESMSISTLYTYKPIYGVLLTCIVTPIGLRIALSEQPNTHEQYPTLHGAWNLRPSALHRAGRNR